MNKEKPPKVVITGVTLQENYYTNPFNRIYSTTKLIEHSKQYPVFEIPLAAIDTSRSVWEMNDLEDFIHHAKRTQDADLNYPILLDNYGKICDGMHRVSKAIILGKRTIKAIRLETMPPYDRIEESEDE